MQSESQYKSPQEILGKEPAKNYDRPETIALAGKIIGEAKQFDFSYIEQQCSGLPFMSEVPGSLLYPACLFPLLDQIALMLNLTLQEFGSKQSEFELSRSSPSISKGMPEVIPTQLANLQFCPQVTLEDLKSLTEYVPNERYNIFSGGKVIKFPSDNDLYFALFEDNNRTVLKSVIKCKNLADLQGAYNLYKLAYGSFRVFIDTTK